MERQRERRNFSFTKNAEITLVLSSIFISTSKTGSALPCSIRASMTPPGAKSANIAFMNHVSYRMVSALNPPYMLTCCQTSPIWLQLQLPVSLQTRSILRQIPAQPKRLHPRQAISCPKPCWECSLGARKPSQHREQESPKAERLHQPPMGHLPTSTAVAFDDIKTVETKIMTKTHTAVQTARFIQRATPLRQGDSQLSFRKAINAHFH